ncbi:MAG: SDR family NAD(P)-dependent oxidoreductase [Rhodobacterales bacterium]|nr:SDR family NAD(P)-dependent oxidoreductase [Rhodobacterales bacterium]
MANLSGKWAFVTGASRGVGHHIAAGLAAQGCNLVLHSRETAHTAALTAKLTAQGTKVIPVAAELSDPAQVEAMLDQVQSAGPIDILYNNAALMTPKRSDPWDTPAADLGLSFQVNVIALVRICARLAPPMVARRWGRIVNLTSGIMDQPELTAYAISKAAVDKYVRDFAPALRGSGVTMNLLDPGWLRTDLGGANAPGDPASVLPGALVPALLDDGVSGRFFRAQDYAGLDMEEALEKAVAG